jgi:hypothetical protein
MLFYLNKFAKLRHQLPLTKSVLGLSLTHLRGASTGKSKSNPYRMMPTSVAGGDLNTFWQSLQ